MDAIFRIKGNEFDEALFKKIKALLRKSGDAKVVIQVTDEQDAYHRSLQKSISELSDPPENLISFTMEELVAYNKKRK